MSTIGDLEKASSVISRAMMGEELALVQVITGLVLIIISLLLYIFWKTYTLNKSKVYQSFCKVEEVCESRFTTLAVTEEKVSAIEKRLFEAEKTLAEHQQSTTFEFEKINTRISSLEEKIESLEHLIVDKLFPKVSGIAESLNFLQGAVKNR